MEPDALKQNLIEKFIAGSLNEQEKQTFQNMLATDAEFEKEAFEQAYIDASLEHIGKKIRGKQPLGNVVLFKRIVTISLGAAAAILILFFALKLNEFPNHKPNVLVETDTVFLPKSEYFKLPNAIVPIHYAQNTEMDKLVDLSSKSMRSSDSDICLPHHNAYFQMGNNVEFELSQFKPDKYRLLILGFYEQVTAVDTLLNKTVRLISTNKTVYKWQPKIKGVYYWLLYLPNKTEPYLVRRLIVN